MLKKRFKNEGKPFSILRLYTFSCLFFFVLTVFSVYDYRVYDTWSLYLFYIYEVILWLGIKVGGDSFRIRRALQSNAMESTERFSFIINKQGQIIISFICFGALLSFVYFLILYRGVFSVASLGTSLKAEFDYVARTKLEVITQFVLYAGSSVYLLVVGSKNTVSQFTLRLARLCLFLPGIRGALLGRRFILAVETLIFIFAEYKSINNQIRSMDPKNKKAMKRIIIISTVVVLVLLFIFSRRIVYLPEAMFVAYPGDMELSPFWKGIYSQIGDQMNILAYVSFYVSQAPYGFSYSYEYLFEDFPYYWGLRTFRVFIQILTNLFGLSPSYAEMVRQVPGIARYSGYAGAVVSDFGKYLAPFVSFLLGFIFSRIEHSRNTNSICHNLYPIVQVACIFAPVYFFSVGDLDQLAIWVVVFTPFCIMRCNKRNEEGVNN